MKSLWRYANITNVKYAAWLEVYFKIKGTEENVLHFGNSKEFTMQKINFLI